MPTAGGASVMAWDVFRFCTALRGLGFLMVLLVLGVVGVTYYAVVLTNYGPALVHGGGVDSLVFVGVLILFHVLVSVSLSFGLFREVSYFWVLGFSLQDLF